MHFNHVLYNIPNYMFDHKWSDRIDNSHYRLILKLGKSRDVNKSPLEM
jgi:hypothetical protein